MTEEKPQKADLREPILAEKWEIDWSDGIAHNSSINRILALIDADSKAREEEKKRLTKKIGEKIDQYNRLIEVWKKRVEDSILQGEREQASRILLANQTWQAALIWVEAELTASKQDSEGIG